MFFFGRKPKTHLGLDIGTSAIKLVELSKENERFKLENYAIFPIVEYPERLEQKIRTESLKMREQEMSSMIKLAIKEAGIKSEKVCLSVPVYSSFSTLIDLPFMPEKEIATAIPFEAKKYVPVPISEVILDWSIIEKTKSAPLPPPLGNEISKDSRVITRQQEPSLDSGQKPQDPMIKPEEKAGGSEGIQVLLVAVPKEVAAKYARIIQMAGLELKALEAETFSLTRSLVGNDKSSIVIVDTGARSTNISVVDGGYIRVTHNLEMGGAQLTKNLGKKMQIDFEKAEEIKKSELTSANSQGKEFTARETVQSFLEAVVSETKRIVNHYQLKYNRRIEKCILAGSGLAAAGLIDEFTNKLGLEVSLGNPFARIIYSPVLEPAVKELGPPLAVAVGLAMRE